IHIEENLRLIKEIFNENLDKDHISNYSREDNDRNKEKNIYNDEGEEECEEISSRIISVDVELLWIVLAKGHGYFSRHTRNVKIIYRKKTLTGQLPLTHEIRMQNELLDSFIFVTSFDSKNLNKNEVIEGHIENHSKTSLSLTLSQYNAEEILSNNLNNIIMKWCLIDTNQNDYLISDVEKKNFN
ncbi:15312_t:CDS:2, partial [Racocetra persica]